MKKILGIIFIAVIFIGCKKSSSDSDNSDYYVRFKVDGQLKEYRKDLPNNNVLILPAGNDAFHYATITGMSHISADPAEIYDFIQITVKDTIPIKTGFVYKMHEAVTNNGFQHPRIILTYSNENKVVYSANVLRAYSNVTIPNDVEVVFDELTSTYARGSFKATAMQADLVSLVSVTEGEFYLKVFAP